MTIQEFIRKNRIKMKVERWHENPNNPDWLNADHWRCLLKRRSGYKGRKRQSMTVYFSKGYGHEGKPPKVGEVLDCLASDGATWENCPNFEDFCSEFGYDTDSRKAESLYKSIGRQTKRLNQFLNGQAQVLYWEVDRL